jgi:hypothetical protein
LQLGIPQTTVRRVFHNRLHLHDSTDNKTWVTLLYSISSFIFFSGLNILGHGIFDNNLESICSLLHRVKTRLHFFPPLHSHFASFPSLYLLSDLPLPEGIADTAWEPSDPKKFVTFRPVVTIIICQCRLCFLFSPFCV